MDKKKKLITQKISAKIKEIDASAEIYLFGSRARGDEKPDSDWDILILSKNQITLKDEQKFRHHLIPLELELGEAFSVFVFSKKEWDTRHSITPFYHNVKFERIQI